LEEGRPTSLGALFHAISIALPPFLAKSMNSKGIEGSPLTFDRTRPGRSAGNLWL